MVFRIANDGHFAAALANDVAFRHGSSRVIGPFGVEVRPNKSNDLGNRRLVEYRYGVNASKRSNDLCTLVLRDDRSTVTFKFAHLLVGIDRYQQSSAERFCADQISYMPGMYEIETAVCQNEFRAPAPGYYSKVSKLYNVAGMPTTVFIDRKGNVREVHKSYRPGDENLYLTQIRSLLKE